MERASHPSPCNFRWILKGRLSASGLPDTVASLQWLRNSGTRLVVHLCKECPPDGKAYEQAGLQLYYSPVDDYCAPAPWQAQLIISKIKAAIANSEVVHICCHHGIGRAPTVAAMYLVSTGIAAEDALRSVCMTNALGSYGTRSQKNAVRRLAQDLSHRFVIDVRIE